ncbi:hypothetical protein Tco_0890610 [Tanacetum coccineum]|uniref:DC1 domain-containing protein n=1 Tax=Tanacetum coccineum TaxID=301880 RepID=A0ABQ5C3Z3_9ASTR
MWSKHPENEEEYDEEEEEMDDSVPKQDIRYLCNLCSKEITWHHRYYAHPDCATSRVEPFMSIFMTPGMGRTLKNYDDAEHPDLLHLPLPDQTYSILKHLFFKENGPQVNEVNKTHISHQHPLVLVDTRCADISEPTSSKTKAISYHNPMKKIELLCDGCVRPIMRSPFYKCANEVKHCNFVLHECCTRLPAELKDHPDHPQHTLLLPKIPHKLSKVFECVGFNLD